MAVTVSVYNHTAARFLSGANAEGDTYTINLYSAFSFDATHTTKAAAETGATQLTTANGYTQNAMNLVNVAVSTVTTNDAKLAADNVSWTASGGDIGPARYALVYNNTDTDDPPLCLIDFGENKTAGSGTPFNINWNASGIFTLTVT